MEFYRVFTCIMEGDYMIVAIQKKYNLISEKFNNYC